MTSNEHTSERFRSILDSHPKMRFKIPPDGLMVLYTEWRRAVDTGRLVAIRTFPDDSDNIAAIYVIEKPCG